MKGNPKFKLGDNVKFNLYEYEYDDNYRIIPNSEKLVKVVSGSVYIIDAYGTWDDPSDVSYDIMGDDNVLYKHITESLILS